MDLKKNILKLKIRQLDLLEEKKKRLLSQTIETYRPYKKQIDFHKQGVGARERLFLAGNRCGKTLCGAMEMAVHLTGIYPKWWQGVRFDKPIQAWAASVTAEATRDILQRVYLGGKDGIMGCLPADKILRVTARRGVVDAVDSVFIQHVSGGVSTLGFKSYDQGREKFQGTVRHMVHLDEEPSVDIYEECVLRTATVKGHILLTLTPLMGLTELVESFVNAKKGSGKYVVRAGWSDAPHLGEQEKERLRKSLRPHEIEAREYGTPSLGSGRVFPISEEQIKVERFEIPLHFKRVFGIDFGWTNPTAAVWGGYDNDTNTLYIYDVYKRSELAPQEHAKYLQTRGEWIPGVCDPAGQSASQADGKSLVEHYADHGIKLTYADNGVEAGLMRMLERMQTAQLKVFADLDSWWEEFRLYRRDKTGRIVKKNDHLMDATRYLVTTGITLARTKPLKQKYKRLQSGDGWLV